jgi:hypothetical protein
MAVDPMGGSGVVTGQGSPVDTREAELRRLEEEMRRLQLEMERARREAEQARTEAEVRAARAAEESLRSQLNALSSKIGAFEAGRAGTVGVGEKNRVIDLKDAIAAGRTSVTATLQKLDQTVVVATPRTTGNRIFDDEILAAASVPPGTPVQTYRLDPDGRLVPDTASSAVPPQMQQQLEQQYDQLSPADKERITRAEFVTQGAEDYQVAFDAHAQAVRDIDARIAAAMDDAGPNSNEVRMLRAQRERLIESQVQAAVQDHHTTRDAAGLAAEYTADPARWAEVAPQMGLDPASPPDPDAIKQFLQAGQKIDANARIAGQIAMNNLPAGASAADREAARVGAETGSRLEAMVAQGLVEVPGDADPEAWVAAQVQLAAATEAERQRALAAGVDPNLAVQKSDKLFEMQLDAALQSGAVRLEGATPEQVAEWKDREVSRFREAVALANQSGLSLPEARERIRLAYAVQDQRIDAQLQINAMVEVYNASTSAVQRGGEFLLGSAAGDGMNNLEWAQQEVGTIETLEREYQAMLLDTSQPLDAARRAELDARRAEIDRRIAAVREHAGADFQSSHDRAYYMSFVETALFTVVYTGSAALGPLGLVTGGITKAFLQDLPNGQIRNDGDWLETAGDLATSGVLGAGEVGMNMIPGAQGWSGVVLDMAANGGFSAVNNLVTQTRAENPEGIDWQQVAYAGAMGAGGSALGSAARMPLGRFGGEAGQQIGRFEAGLFDAATAFSVGSMMDAAGQYTATGQVDFQHALDAGMHGVVETVTTVPSGTPELQPLDASGEVPALSTVPVADAPGDAPTVRADDALPADAPAFTMPDLPQGIVSPQGIAALDQLFDAGGTPTFNQAVRWRDDIGAALDTRVLSPEVRARLQAEHTRLDAVIADYRASGASGPIESPFNPLSSVERAHEAGIQTGIDQQVAAGQWPNGVDPAYLARRQREGLADIDPLSVLPTEDQAIPVDAANVQDYLTRRTWDQYLDFAGIYQVPAVHGNELGVVGQARPDAGGAMQFTPLEMDTYLAAIDMDPRLQSQDLIFSVSCYASVQPEGGSSIAQAVAQHTQKPVLSSMEPVSMSTRPDGVRVWASDGPWTLTYPDGRVETLTKAQVDHYPFVEWRTW